MAEENNPNIPQNSSIKILEKSPFLSLIGLVFFISFIAFLYYAWSKVMPQNIAKLLPPSTAIIVETNLQKIPQKWNNLPLLNDTTEFNIKNLLPPQITNKNLKKFAGPHIALTYQENALSPEIFIQILKPKTAQEFLEKNFLLPGEKFIHKNEIFTPEFSSHYHFTYLKNYLVISTSESNLQKIKNTQESLQEQKNYQEIFTDLPSQNILKIFIDSPKSQKLLQTILTNADLLPTESPLQKTFYQALPSGGFTLNTNEQNELEIRTKFLTHPDIKKETTLRNPLSNNIPQSSQIAPAKIIWYQNGHDLHQKYIQTKKFLASLHPELPTIFDAALRAQSKKIFGKNFDHEKDFLAHFQNEYAFIINTEDSAYPFFHYTFLSQLKTNDREKLLNQFHQAIHSAQSHNEIQTTQVVLPSGRKRDALQVTPEAEIFIRKIEQEDTHYFSIKNPNTQTEFSYGIVDNFFVLSSHEEGIQQIISTHKNPKQSLAHRPEFHYKVNQVFTPSESYTYLSNTRLQKALSLVTPITEEKTTKSPQKSSILNPLKNLPISDMVANKKVFPNALYYQIILTLP